MSSVSIAPTRPVPTLPQPVRPTDAFAHEDGDDTRPRALVVEVSGATYGLLVDDAREVVRALRVTRVPGAPTETLGIVNVRGVVVTVLDLAAILHSSRAVTGASVVLIENGTRLVGFAVDAVRDVRALDVDADGVASGDGIVLLDAAALCARYLISGEEMGR